MGIHSWRNLSVLLLAGVALVGCNNGPDKPKQPIGSNGIQQNGGLAKGPFQDQWQGNNQQFPVAKQPNNQSPFQPTSGGLNNAGGFGNVPGGAGNVPGGVGNVPGGVGNVPPSFPPIQGGVQQGVRTTQPGFADDPTRPNTGGFGGQPIQPPAGFRPN